MHPVDTNKFFELLGDHRYATPGRCIKTANSLRDWLRGRTEPNALALAESFEKAAGISPCVSAAREIPPEATARGTIPLETSMSDFTPDPPGVCYGDPEAEARERYRGHRDAPARPDDHDLPERKDTVITIWMSHPRDPYPSFAYRQHCIERYVVMPFGWALTHDDTHGVVCADLKGTRSTAATVLMNAERLALGFCCRVAP